MVFQHTAARRRLGNAKASINGGTFVSTHSRPKAAGISFIDCLRFTFSFNTQPPEGGWRLSSTQKLQHLGFQHTAARRRLVSTNFMFSNRIQCFNTQPPEGGWAKPINKGKNKATFQHTAARRRLDGNTEAVYSLQQVSTHSRPKAAGPRPLSRLLPAHVSTHSRPKAAGHLPQACFLNFWVSTHSRPKAAGMAALAMILSWMVSTHSRPKAAGNLDRHRHRLNQFQHTAARRRLAIQDMQVWLKWPVSTHSRPKAAGF